MDRSDNEIAALRQRAQWLPRQHREAWAREQLAQVDCGDLRRDQRLCSLLGAMIRQPGQSLPQQCESSAPLKATYRLLQGQHVQPHSIVQSAAHATTERLRHHHHTGVVLAVQDTTTTNFTTHEAMEGRGPIGNSDKFRGFHVHTTLLLGQHEGVHGLQGCEIYARDGEAQKARKPGERNRQSSQQKESHRWVRSVQDSAQLCEELPLVEAVINIADREADMYELLVEAQRLHKQHQGRFHLLVRAQHDRQLQQDASESSDPVVRLWEHLESQPAQVCWQISMPAPKGIHGTQKRQVEALWSPVNLEVPAHQRKYKGHEQPVRVNIIMVREPRPPEGQPALEWVLLTTWPISDVIELQRVVGWYARRWQIEVMHRVLKSGCKVESRRMQQARSAQVMIVLDLLVAVRLMSLVSAARQEPEGPAGKWLSELEQEVLRAHFESVKTGTAGRPLSLGQAMRWIGQLAGHRGAPSSPPPGAEALWRGLTRLHDMTEGWRMAQASKNVGES